MAGLDLQRPVTPGWAPTLSSMLWDVSKELLKDLLWSLSLQLEGL